MLCFRIIIVRTNGAILDIHEDIAVIPDSQRYWVVRSDGGYFARHFLKHGIIAIGHLDNYRIEKIVERVVLQPQEVQMAIAVQNPNSKRRKLHAIWNQVQSFVRDMRPGDIVITMTPSALHFGRITSNAFYSTSELEIEYDGSREPPRPLTHVLRRKVQWGPTIARCDLRGHPLYRSLSANQTVFSADKWKVELNHFLWPIFICNQRAYFSVNIKTEEEIDNLSVAYLQEMLSMVEAASLLARNTKDPFTGDFESQFMDLYYAGDLRLTAKAHYLSPGSIWGAIASLEDFKEILYFYIGYSAIFGSKFVGWDGVIDLYTKQRIYDSFVKLFKKKPKLVKERLKARPPKKDNSKLVDASKDEVADPRSHQLELRLETSKKPPNTS